MDWLDYTLLVIIGFAIGWAIGDKLWNTKK